MFKKIGLILVLSFFINGYLALITNNETYNDGVVTSEAKAYYIAEDIKQNEELVKRNIDVIAQNIIKAHKEEFFYKELFELFIIVIFIYASTLLRSRLDIILFASASTIYIVPEAYFYGLSLMMLFYLFMLIYSVFKAKSKGIRLF